MEGVSCVPVYVKGMESINSVYEFVESMETVFAQQARSITSRSGILTISLCEHDSYLFEGKFYISLTKMRYPDQVVILYFNAYLNTPLQTYHSNEVDLSIYGMGEKYITQCLRKKLIFHQNKRYSRLIKRLMATLAFVMLMQRYCFGY